MNCILQNYLQLLLKMIFNLPYKLLQYIKSSFDLLLRASKFVIWCVI